MHSNKTISILRALLCVALISTPRIAAHADTLKVVATLPTFAALTQEVGGDAVEVSSIGAARFNPHFIEPRPSDVLRLKRADLFVHGGLDLEVWRAALLNAAARAEIRSGGERELDLSRGIRLLNIPQQPVSRAQGDIHLFGNPHYWMSPMNGVTMATAIAAKLSEIDPANTSKYQDNLQNFLKRLNAKSEEWKQRAAPLKGKEALGYHDEWKYLAEFLALKMERFIEPKPGIPPSPRQLADAERAIRTSGIFAIIQPTFYSKDAGESLSRSGGIPLLLLCQNVGELPQCSDYIAMLDYDVTQIASAAEAYAARSR